MKDKEEVLDWLYRIRSCVEIYFPYRWINKCQEALDYAISELKGEQENDR